MSKTLEDLGYEKEEFENCIIFKKGFNEIWFFTEERMVSGKEFMQSKDFSMEELKAIYQYCIDNKWI